VTGAPTREFHQPAAKDPIEGRLAELAGDRTPPELALVERLVTSFRARAPQHVTALDEAFRTGDLKSVEDQAHSLRGAAGNIGADAVSEVCERIENEARAGRLHAGVGDDLRTLRLELQRAADHLTLPV
jgi:HPt (histidine-containing phosphotransfer) domain-containing protein